MSSQELVVKRSGGRGGDFDDFYAADDFQGEPGVVADPRDEDAATTLMGAFHDAGSFFPLLILCSLLVAFMLAGDVHTMTEEDRVQNTFDIWVSLATFFVVAAFVVALLNKMVNRVFWNLHQPADPLSRGAVAAVVVNKTVKWVAVVVLVWIIFAGLLVVGNLVTTAIMYVYSFWRESNEDFVPQENSFFDVIFDARLARELNPGGAGMCDFTSGKSSVSTRMVDVDLGSAPMVNTAGKMQFVVEQAADNSKEDWSQLPFIVWVTKMLVSATGYDLRAVTGCAKLAFLKGFLWISGINVADSMYGYAVQNALPPPTVQTDPDISFYTEFLADSGVWCSRDRWEMWLEYVYAGRPKDNQWHRMFQRHALMFAYNQGIPKDFFDNFGKIEQQAKEFKKRTNNPDAVGDIMLDEPFLATLPVDTQNTLLYEMQIYKAIMRDKEEQFFTYGKMDYDSLDALGLKTSHLRAKDSSLSGQVATNADIDEAVGVNDFYRRKLVRSAAKRRLSRDGPNYGEYKYGARDMPSCATLLPGPPATSSDPYRLQDYCPGGGFRQFCRHRF